MACCEVTVGLQYRVANQVVNIGMMAELEDSINNLKIILFT